MPITGLTCKPRLTGREKDLLRLLLSTDDRNSNKDISYALDLTEGTVKVYFSRLSAKLASSLGLRQRRMSRVGMALWAERIRATEL